LREKHYSIDSFVLGDPVISPEIISGKVVSRISVITEQTSGMEKTS
jgi:hypothetical protein